MLFFYFFIWPIALFSAKIDIKHIKLELQFDWNKKQAFGTAEIILIPLENTNKIALDAGKLSIDRIVWGNKKLRFENKEDSVFIYSDAFLQNSKPVTFKIYYHTNHENRSDPNALGGSFGKGLRFFKPTSATPKKRKQIWSQGEPQNNKYWYPCHEDIADIHTFEITATVEKPLSVFATGKHIQTINNKDGTRTFHYKTEKETPNYLIAIVVGEYQDVILKHENTVIHNYGYPEEVDAVKSTVVLLPEMMRFLEEKTGHKYPFADYSQIVVQDFPFPGLNGQHALVTLSDNYIDDHGVHEDFKYLWDGVAMQALASQWFGNLIMPKSWDDIWLNNAFNQYFAGHFTSYNNGLDEYLLWYYPFEKWNIDNDWSNGNRHPVATSGYSDITDFTRDSYSKFKGAHILRMLEHELGQELWWKTIRLYVKTFARKQVSSKDFQLVVEKAAGRNLQWFFDQWVYKMGYPELEISKAYDEKNKLLTLKVIQNQVPDSSSQFDLTKYFKGKIAIEIDEVQKVIELKGQKESVFTFQLKGKPKFIHFNKNNTFLCNYTYSQTTDEFLAQLKGSNDVIAKQKALDNLVIAYKDSLTSLKIKDVIKNAITSEIKSHQYWRYRQYALGTLRKISSLPYDKEMIPLLLDLIEIEKSWVKQSAILTLANTADSTYLPIYKKSLSDPSDRVINAAAFAIGKTKSKDAKELLLGLENKKSWKNQNRISALVGLEQLGDTTVVDYVLNCIKDNTSPRWYLATPVWDYPFTAVNTLVSLGKGSLAYPILFERFKRSLDDDDVNDIFQNVQLINFLKDERAKEMYVLLEEKFKDDSEISETVKGYKTGFLEGIKL